MRRKSQQLRLDVRLYRVRVEGFADFDAQASSAAAAKYQAFKAGLEAGYFSGGFRDFLSRLSGARELRKV